MGMSFSAVSSGADISSLLRDDFGQGPPLLDQIFPEEGQHVLLGNGVKDLGEAEGIVAAEAALGEGDGDVFEGIQPPEVGAEAGPEGPLEKVLVHALSDQTVRLLLEGGGHGPGHRRVPGGGVLHLGRVGKRHRLHGRAEQALQVLPARD